MASKTAEKNLLKVIKSYQDDIKALKAAIAAPQISKSKKTSKERMLQSKQAKLKNEQTKLKSLRQRLQTKATEGPAMKKQKLSRAGTQPLTKLRTNKPGLERQSTEIISNGSDTGSNSVFEAVQSDLKELMNLHKQQMESYQLQFDTLNAKFDSLQQSGTAEALFLGTEGAGKALPKKIPTIIIPDAAKIPQDFHTKALEKLYANMLAQQLTTAMEWNTTFSGENLSAQQVLTYRKKVHNWFVKGSKTVGWNIELAITKILNKMIGKAEQFAQTREATNLKSEAEFFSWFDITFNVAALRRELYLQCKSWKLPDGITIEQIIPTYTMQYSLLEQTTQYINPTIKKNTTLTTQQKIEAIEFALRPSWKLKYDSYTLINKSTPTTMDQLKTRLSDVALAIQLMNKNNTNLSPSNNNISNTSTNINTNIPNINYLQNNYPNYGNPKRNPQYRRGRGRGRGRGRNNYRNSGGRKYYPPQYNTNGFRPCKYCKKYGHKPALCGVLKKYYSQLIDVYDTTYRKNNNISSVSQNNNNSINSIQNVNTKSTSKENSNHINNIQSNEHDNIQARMVNLPDNTVSFKTDSLDSNNIDNTKQRKN